MAWNIYKSKRLSPIWVVLAVVILAGAVLGVRLLQDVAIKTLVKIELADPLFDFPGASVKDLREIGRILEILNQSFLAEPRLKLENIDFYPHHFWTALADVAEAREEFFINPTRNTAYRLITAEDTATKHYTEHVDAFDTLWKRSIASSVPIISPDHLFNFLNGTKTDIATFSTAIEAIKENGAILKEEVRLRRYCLRYGLCQQSLKEPSINHKISDVTEREKPPLILLPRAYLAATQEILPATGLSQKYFGVESKCFGETSGLNWFLLWQRKYPNGSVTLFPKLVTNSFYRKLDLKHFLPQDAVSVQAGFSYSWQPEVNLYLCPDLDYYPKFASIWAIVERIAKDPWAAKLPTEVSPALRREVETAERAILQNPFLSEYAIDRYASTLQTVLPFLADHHDIRRGIATFIRSWETKSSRMLDVFESLAVDAERYRVMAKIAADNILPITTTLTHSYVSLNYAVWNPSVWRLHDKPNFVFIDESLSSSNNTVVDYWYLQKLLSLSAIMKIQSATKEGAKALWHSVD